MKKKINFVYTGQGSQYPGMLDKISKTAERYPVLARVLEEASDTLGYDVVKTAADESLVGLTQYTQPLLVTYEYAQSFMYSNLSDTPGVMHTAAGHSLGEYSALLSTASTGFAKSLLAVKKRGELMQRAVPVGVGTMAALTTKTKSENFGKDITEILSSSGLNLSVANYNSLSQIVISGAVSDIPHAKELLTKGLSEYKKVRFIPLSVSAPFHSPMMQTIEEEYGDYIRDLALFENGVNLKLVYSNYSSDFYDGTEQDFYEKLKKQISNPVRWTEIMKKVVDNKSECGIILEIGPKPVLKGMFRTIDEDVDFFEGA